MTEYALPVLYCLFMWWFSTGLVIYLDGLPRRTFRWSLLGASLAMAAGFYGLGRSSTDTSIAGAYMAFTCALVIWGWHEMSFLMGVVTGPRRTACPPGARGLRRFRYAVDAILYHELAIVFTACLMIALTWGGANQVGAATFLILWVMRLSAKLNVFFGVLNLTEEILPEQIQYLKTYFRKKPMNLFFPFSIMASTYVAVLLVQHAFAPGATAFERAGYVFLATLMALAILEHWLLVLPIHVEKLWSWSINSRRADGPFECIESPAFDLALAHAIPAPAAIKIDH
jgi:putative photosynthetic complex assembly protein 2